MELSKILGALRGQRLLLNEAIRQSATGCARVGTARRPAFGQPQGLWKEQGTERGIAMLRIFDGKGEQITSEQHTGGEIPGTVRVIVDESADQKEAVTTLLRIASWIEAEDRQIPGAR